MLVTECAASLARSARVAAATSAWRIRLSPTRNVLTPHRCSRAMSAGVKMPLSPMTMRSSGTRGASRSVVASVDVEGLEVAIVDADQAARQVERAVEFGVVVHFDDGVHVPVAGGRGELGGERVVDLGQDDQDAVGTPGARLDNLIGIDHEILAQDGQDGKPCARRSGIQARLGMMACR